MADKNKDQVEAGKELAGVTTESAPLNLMSTEKPILFSGPMVKAILEGRKTQTRRVV